jgi:hypothetical protein
MQLPINWVRLADMSPLAGNLIVVAGDDHTGETIAATEAEIKAVLEHLMPLMEPVTEYEI